MLVGLKRGKVRVVPYQKAWAEEFEREKARILKVCGSKVIVLEHIGSTSVPGLAAKPIIDIAVGIKKFKDAEKLIRPLNTIGYRFYKSFQRQRLFVAKGPDERRTHYLHVMRYNGVKWKSDQLFRNYLRSHPTVAKQYGELKRKLAKIYQEDRHAYSDKKDSFIKSVITQANTGKTKF